MQYIINEELLDWIKNNEQPANDPQAINNFSHDDIGDWAGEEERATQQLNWIMLTLETVLQHAVNRTSMSSFKNQVWNDWSKNTRILDINEQDMANYVNSLVARNAVIFPDEAAA
ncbi:MAG: hypothetical protein L0Z73_15430 [Gammaproteobacteria bacterium]|nr:hypothetical protein [Gammaproteobacteria bacterium]